MLLLSAAFTLSFALDIVWALYVTCIAAKMPGRAALYSSLIVALGGLNVLVFVRSPWSVFAAALGGFCGTYVGVSGALRAWRGKLP
jgi:hypothetical protein